MTTNDAPLDVRPSERELARQALCHFCKHGVAHAVGVCGPGDGYIDARDAEKLIVEVAVHVRAEAESGVLAKVEEARREALTEAAQLVAKLYDHEGLFGKGVSRVQGWNLAINVATKDICTLRDLPPRPAAPSPEGTPGSGEATDPPTCQPGEPMWVELKCWPEPFQAIKRGAKRFDYREIRDRDFRVGTTLYLREWDPGTTTYTGDVSLQRVTYILRGPAFGIPVGHCVMSIDSLTAPPSRSAREVEGREATWTHARCDACGRLMAVDNAAKSRCISCQLPAPSAPVEPATVAAGDDFDPGRILAKLTLVIAQRDRHRATLAQVADVMALSARSPKVDSDYGGAIAELGEEVGFGVLMSSAEASWRETLARASTCEALARGGAKPGAEFVSGPCRSTWDALLERVRTSLSEQGAESTT